MGPTHRPDLLMRIAGLIPWFRPVGFGPFIGFRCGNPSLGSVGLGPLGRAIDAMHAWTPRRCTDAMHGCDAWGRCIGSMQLAAARLWLRVPHGLEDCQGRPGEGDFGCHSRGPKRGSPKIFTVLCFPMHFFYSTPPGRGKKKFYSSPGSGASDEDLQ